MKPAPPDPRQLERAARAYAESRSLPFLLSMSMGAALFAVLALMARQMVIAYTGHSRFAFWAWLVAQAAATGLGLFFLFVHPFGDRLRGRLCERFYGEGCVTLDQERSEKWRGLAALIIAVFGICFVGTALLVARGWIPRTHVQPWSALYFVPFLTFLVFWQQPMIGWRWGLLWPALYGIHALLLATGVMPPFQVPWTSLNMVIPLFGYGVLAGVVGHWQSRRALRRLRDLTHAPLPPDPEDPR